MIAQYSCVSCVLLSPVSSPHRPFCADVACFPRVCCLLTIQLSPSVQIHAISPVMVWQSDHCVPHLHQINPGVGSSTPTIFEFNPNRWDRIKALRSSLRNQLFSLVSCLISHFVLFLSFWISPNPHPHPNVLHLCLSNDASPFSLSLCSLLTVFSHIVMCHYHHPHISRAPSV